MFGFQSVKARIRKSARRFQRWECDREEGSLIAQDQSQLITGIARKLEPGLGSTSPVHQSPLGALHPSTNRLLPRRRRCRKRTLDGGRPLPLEVDPLPPPPLQIVHLPLLLLAPYTFVLHMDRAPPAALQSPTPLAIVLTTTSLKASPLRTSLDPSSPLCATCTCPSLPYSSGS